MLISLIYLQILRTTCPMIRCCLQAVIPILSPLSETLAIVWHGTCIFTGHICKFLVFKILFSNLKNIQNNKSRLEITEIQCENELLAKDQKYNKVQHTSPGPKMMWRLHYLFFVQAKFILCKYKNTWWSDQKCSVLSVGSPSTLKHNSRLNLHNS